VASTPLPWQFDHGRFRCGPQRLANLTTVVDDGHLKIDRASITPSRQSLGEQSLREGELPYRGTGGLVETLCAAVDSFSDATDVRFEVEVFRVVSAPSEVSTRQYFSISGRTMSGTVEQHATWDIG